MAFGGPVTLKPLNRFR